MVLEDAHRWTTFFCRHCAPHVAALNRTVGWPVIAYGKHTIINGAFIRPTDADAPAKLSAALRRTAAGMKVLNTWVDGRVTVVLRNMGVDHGTDVCVPNYFDFVPHGPEISARIFAEPCAHFGANAELGA